MTTKIPLTVITGYLGAGKTTLLRHILNTTDKKLAVIMNEFGKIGIDNRIIKGKNVEMIELSGGCVCCSLTGEFEAAIKEILETVKPEWIVMETTGTAEPDAILFSTEDFPTLRLDAIITVVDADAMTRFPQLSRTAQVQIETADIILINKTDLVAEDHIDTIQTRIRSLNHRAVVANTVKGEVDASILLGVETAQQKKEKKHIHTPVDSFTFSTSKIFDRAAFDAVISSLPKEVYRAKGFVVFPDGSFLFNYVAGRTTLEPFPAKKTELVFLGEGITQYKKTVLSKLKNAEEE